MAQDFYPASRDALAPWYANFAAQLPGLAAKYDISAALLALVAADNNWIQYWVQFRTDADAMSQALTRYFNTIKGNDPSVAPPAAVVWALTAGTPPEVPPGIEDRVRDIARQIKGDMDYAPADGERLGIVSPTSGVGVATASPGVDFSPEFTLRTLAAFQLEASFRKRGYSAVRFQYRHSGGQWLAAGTLIDSPGSFSIPPSVPNTAEQIEVRGIYLKGNVEVGVYSEAKPAFIAQ